jgi:hypothetical protein
VNILTFCRWLATTHVGIAMRDSTWGFAIVEIGHLLALAVLGGAILLVDLRFLNLGLRTQTVSRVAREFLPLTIGGVLAMSVSGIFMLANGPVRYYYNPAFRVKIVLFVIALIFHFTLQVFAALRRPEAEPRSRWLQVAALFSLVLWLSIGVAGRAIGYV